MAVLGLFAASAFVVPTLAPVATTDDWGYARSVEILLDEGRLEIFPVVAATAVFQVLWGALFAAFIEPDLGAVRLSTATIAALGGWALYGLCRRLGIGRGRAALGTAAYLFNPLAFALAFSFMTDTHFASLLLIATCFYVRGLAPGSTEPWATVAGSAVAGLAFLTRQQGALIPLAVLTSLLIAGRLRPNRDGIGLFLRVGALPIVAAVGYLAWLRFFNDVPAVQTAFVREAARYGWAGTWGLIQRLTFVELVYLGFFALPIVVAAVPALRRLLAPLPGPGLLLLLGWEAVVVGGAVAGWVAGARMPYISQFFGRGGLGPPDVLGSRPILFEADARSVFTVVCVVASVLLGLVFCRQVGAGGGGGGGGGDGNGIGLATLVTPERAQAGLVLAVALWQVGGVLPPSYHYIRRGGSLDRYLLPLLPLAILLALWALREVRFALPAGWLVVAAFGAFAVAGTRDYLVWMGAVWDLARFAQVSGVPLDKLDAGSGWDGYHLYEISRDNKIKARTPKGPWWVYFYAPATDSTYVVATRRLPGYVAVSHRRYASWLERDPTDLYLLRRFGAPWPPDAASTEERLPDPATGPTPVDELPAPPRLTGAAPDGRDEVGATATGVPWPNLPEEWWDRWRTAR